MIISENMQLVAIVLIKMKLLFSLDTSEMIDNYDHVEYIKFIL